MSAPTSPADILRAARARIDTPEKWARGCGARDEIGRSVSSTSKIATSFCSYAAIDLHLSATETSPEGKAAILFRKIVGDCIVDWNDAPGRTHAEVMDAFSRAIALAEQERDALARRLIAEVVQENAAGQS